MEAKQELQYPLPSVSSSDEQKWRNHSRKPIEPVLVVWRMFKKDLVKKSVRHSTLKPWRTHDF